MKSKARIGGMKAIRILQISGVFLLGLYVSLFRISTVYCENILTLKDSIEIALKQSVLIHSAREGISGANAQEKEAFAAFFPKLSTSYSYTRLNKAPYFLFPGIPGLIPRSEMTTGTQDNYAWSLEARQPIFTGGGITSNFEASKLGVEIAKTEELITVLDVIYDVKESYFNIIKSQMLLEVARQSVKRLEAHRDMAQSFFDVGIIPKNDLLHAEVELVNGYQFLLRSENTVEMAHSKFNTVLRRGMDRLVILDDVLKYEPFEKSFEDCLTIALENRPELKYYKLKFEQARKMVSAAKSDYYPSVNFIGSYVRFGDTPGVSGSAFKDQESWQFGLVANWNFWEWGKTKSKVELRKSQENQVADSLIHLKDQVTLDVKNAYLFLREAEKQIFVSDKAIEQAEENFRIAKERYIEHIATSTDVLDAQTLLTKAKADNINALGNYHISRAKLERAMGLLEFSYKSNN